MQEIPTETFPYYAAGGYIRATSLIDNTASTESLTFNVYTHASIHATLLVEQGLNQALIS
jgi:hypothetical protein